MADRTPLYAEHVALGGRMVDFHGWEMPLQYSSIKEEHLAVRKAAGLFDLSHMGRVSVNGRGARQFLQGLLTNDLSTLESGQAQYTLMCREDGGILDDLVVYFGPDGYLLVVNASNRESDLEWIRDHAPTDVEIADQTFMVALIALQGPKAEALLPAEGIDKGALPYFGFARGKVAGVEGLISRTGYTGEDGFELFIPAEAAASVWRALVEAGAAPAGLGARDACRLEAGLRLYGNDMDVTTNPYDAGLGWTVKLAKGDFIGSRALAEIKAMGPARVVYGLVGEERTIPRQGAAVMVDSDPAGVVTSGTWSFFLERGIGMASFKKESVTPKTLVNVDLRGRPAPAKVVKLPIYRGSVRTPQPITRRD